MAFSNQTNLTLGNLLQIMFTEGVRTQISRAFPEFDLIKKIKVKGSNPRQIKFMLNTGFGPAAIQYRNPGTSGRAFPTAQKSRVTEPTADLKEIDGTVELEYQLYESARTSPEKYAEPLAMEVENKTTAKRRRICADWYGDGTGVVGTVTSASDASIASGLVTVTLNEGTSARGHAGQFEIQDLLLAKQSNGTARTPTGGSGFYAYRVKSKNLRAGTVVLEIVSSAEAVISTYTASGLTAGDMFYRIGQPTFPDLSGSVSDYGTVTEVFPGLESWTANDGRTLFGLTMDGTTKGTRVDAGTDPVSTEHIQQLLTDLKYTVGEDVYKWAQLTSHPKTYDAFINAGELDRRFQVMDDIKRGSKYFAYVHGNDMLRMVSREFCAPQRIWALPDNQASEGKVFEYYGTDFSAVKAPNGDEFHLKPASGGGHTADVVSYMHARFVIICNHPAAVGAITNFTIG
jgi:hypothetical protein